MYGIVRRRQTDIFGRTAGRCCHRLVALIFFLLLAIVAGAHHAHARPTYAEIANDPQVRNAADALRQAAIGAAPRVRARLQDVPMPRRSRSVGLGNPFVDLAFNAGNLICDTWIITFRQRLQSLVIREAQNPDMVEVIDAAQRLLNQVVAHCQPITDPHHTAGDPITTAGSDPDLMEEPAEDDRRPPPVRYPTGVVSVPDKICYSRCQSEWRAMHGAEHRLRRASDELANTKRRAWALADHIPHLERRVEAAINNLEVVTARLEAASTARTRNINLIQSLERERNAADMELSESRYASRRGRESYEETLRQIPERRQSVIAARTDLIAALEALRDCLRRCREIAALARQTSTFADDVIQRAERRIVILGELNAHESRSAGDEVTPTTRTAMQVSGDVCESVSTHVSFRTIAPDVAGGHLPSGTAIGNGAPPGTSPPHGP